MNNKNKLAETISSSILETKNTRKDHFKNCARCGAAAVGGFALSHIGCGIALSATLLGGITSVVAVSPVLAIAGSILGAAAGATLWYRHRFNQASRAERVSVPLSIALGAAISIGVMQMDGHHDHHLHHHAKTTTIEQSYNASASSMTEREYLELMLQQIDDGSFCTSDPEATRRSIQQQIDDLDNAPIKTAENKAIIPTLK